MCEMEMEWRCLHACLHACVTVVDNFQALVQYSDAIAAQTGKAVCCPVVTTFYSYV